MIRMPETRWSYIIDVVERTIEIIDELMYYFSYEYEQIILEKEKKRKKLEKKIDNNIYKK